MNKEVHKNFLPVGTITSFTDIESSTGLTRQPDMMQAAGRHNAILQMANRAAGYVLQIVGDAFWRGPHRLQGLEALDAQRAAGQPWAGVGRRVRMDRTPGRRVPPEQVQAGQ
jgi:hypothetical protein